MYQRSILVLTLLTVILVIVPIHASAQSENMMATVETKSGNFVIEFFPDVAPSHVNISLWILLELSSIVS